MEILPLTWGRFTQSAGTGLAELAVYGNYIK
jgi:hypothetical protein